MKRSGSFSDEDVKRARVILERVIQFRGQNVDEGWSRLESLANIDNGRLLAKILSNLQANDLIFVCRTSKTIRKICLRYQMFDRLHVSSLWTCGSPDYYSLGFETYENVEIFTKVPGLPPIQSVSCGEYHAAVVTLSGELYTFGDQVDGQLGNGKTVTKGVLIPQKVLNIPPVKSVSCGEWHSAFVTISGELYTFGSGQFGRLGHGTPVTNIATPLKVEGLPLIESVCCGNYNTAVVTQDGDLYMFGDGAMGKLGNGRTDDHEISTPFKVPNLPPVQSVSIEGNTTAVVTRSGELYMFGNGKGGMLGDGILDNHNVPTPTKVENLPLIESVSCGFLFTAVVTRQGDLYMFGRGERGCLGDGRADEHYVATPQRVEGLPPIQSASTGAEYTAVVTRLGELYTFGDGSFSTLGNGRSDDHSVTRPMKITNVPLVKSVSCGSCNTAIVTVDQTQLDLPTIDVQCIGCANVAQFFTETGKTFCSKVCQNRLHFH